VDELDVKEIQVLLNFFSLEDDLIKVLRRQYSQMGRIFNPRKMFHRIRFINKSLETEKVELYNYELRKNVFQYDILH
jgi:preprotein translocase subunit SecA